MRFSATQRERRANGPGPGAPSRSRLTPQHHGETTIRASSERLRIDALLVGFVATVAACAAVTGVPYLLFPELAALALDVLARPRGLWARQPVHLVLLPAATGLLGLLVSSSLGYGLVPIALCVVGGIGALRLARSRLLPAMSAALLPVVLGTTSFLYPLAILAGTAMLGATLALRRRLLPDTTEVAFADSVEAPIAHWAPLLALVLLLAYAGVLASGHRLMLYPPLAVLSLHALAYPGHCPWAPRPLALVVACGATATAGTFAALLMPIAALGVALATIFGLVVLRHLRLHCPSALAVGLIPFVSPVADPAYPLAALAGTSTLAIVLAARNAWGCRP